MSTLTVVQARMSSERLPGKALMDVGGKPVLQHVLCRVQQADVGPFVVATSARGADNPIADLCALLDVPCLRGSERDVLDRFYLTAKHFGNDHEDDVVVRVTADCPLLCPSLLREVVERQPSDPSDPVFNDPADYVGVHGAPNGFGQECLRFGALEQAWQEADSAYDREHVVPFIEDDPEAHGFRRAYVEADEALRSRSHFRLTVDDEGDLELLRRLYGVTGGALFGLSSREILAAVESDQALTALAARRL